MVMKRIVEVIMNRMVGPSTKEGAEELRRALELNATATENEREFAESLNRTSEGLKEALRNRTVVALPQTGNVK